MMNWCLDHELLLCALEIVNHLTDCISDLCAPKGEINVFTHHRGSEPPSRRPKDHQYEGLLK